MEAGPASRPDSRSLCALLAKGNSSCAACLATHAKLEKRARLKSQTLKCFAGLCETAIPVRVGDNLIAFLETGRVLFNRPDKAGFKKITAQLVEWGTQVDLKKVEEAYFNSKVVSRRQYSAIVRLLEIFAGHLAECGQSLSVSRREPASVRKAKTWITDHSGVDISLGEAARAVNMSAKYFSEVFSRAAGMPFVEYVSRVRIEKARAMLADPDTRIVEIAFGAGFGSLSQFNRAFRKFVGQSPRQYRKSRAR
jgi:AraC-like DNA-binding protein